MFFESIVLPFIVGLVVNKTSDELFKLGDLQQIVQEIYHDVELEFNTKYRDAFGGKYNNFLARDENLQLVLKTVLSFEDISAVDILNTSDFEGNITPIEVVNEFLLCFNNKLNTDNRLLKYRGAREHQLLTENILIEVNKLKHVRFRKFVSPTEYFVGGTNFDTIVINKTNKDVARIVDGLLDNDIILVDSFRGFGKTGTLASVSVVKDIEDNFDSILVMRHGVRNIIDALQSELVEGIKYLIIIDDIDLCHNDFIEVLNFIKSTKIFNKIIVSSQTHSFEEMKQIVANTGFMKQLKQVSLNNWEKENYIELLRASSKSVVVEDEDMIVVKYPSPSLIKWIGENRTSSAITSIEKLFSEYKERLENDVYGILNSYISREGCKKLLFSLCCSVPLKESENTFKLINESLQGEYDMQLILNLLLDGGILRKVGNNYRFYPDLIGDIYLAYSINNDYDTKILNFWMKQSKSIVLENISEASLVSGMEIQDKLKPLIDEWSISQNYYEQRKNLEVANYIVKFSPDSVLNLIYCYLPFAKKSNGEKYSQLTTDNFGPVLLRLWKFGTNREAILNFLCELEENELDGVYDNYKVKGIIIELFSPVKNSSDTIIDALSILTRWIEEEKNGALSLYEYSASEILRGSHEVTKSIINGIQYSQRMVNASKGIIEVRDKCINIINFLLSNKFNYQSIKTIEIICNYFGHSYWGGVDAKKLPLNEVIAKERELIVDLLGKKLLESNDIACNIILERILINWWASQYSSISVETYLTDFKRDGRYLFAKYYVDVDYRVISFGEIKKIAPSEERWKWFVYEVMNNTNDIRNDSKRIAEMLKNVINTTSDLFEFLASQLKIIRNFKLGWSSPSIIDEWCKLNSELFIEYISTDYYAMTDGIFKAKIIESVVMIGGSCNLELINCILKPENQLSNDEIFTLLQLATHASLNDSYVVKMVQIIIENYYLENSGGIIRSLYFIFKDREQKLVNGLLINIIRKYPFNESIVDMLNFLFHHFIAELKDGDDFQELKDEILIRLHTSDKFDNNENMILEMLLTSKEEAMDFIEKRLASSNGYAYPKVPFKGFTFLKKFILDTVTYDVFVSNVIELHAKELISDYDKSQIVKPWFMTKEMDDEILGVNLLKKYRSENYLNGVLILMESFVLNINTVEAFVEALIFLSDNNMIKEAEKILYGQRFPEGVWSRSIGADSPEFLSTVSLYSEIHKLLPYGKLKMVVERCIDYLRKDMAEDLISDEELLNPR